MTDVNTALHLSSQTSHMQSLPIHSPEHICTVIENFVFRLSKVISKLVIFIPLCVV